jgi:hypothetical protein
VEIIEPEIQEVEQDGKEKKKGTDGKQMPVPKIPAGVKGQFWNLRIIKEFRNLGFH